VVTMCSTLLSNDIGLNDLADVKSIDLALLTQQKLSNCIGYLNLPESLLLNPNCQVLVEKSKNFIEFQYKVLTF
jgi:hypothetical protein